MGENVSFSRQIQSYRFCCVCVSSLIWCTVPTGLVMIKWSKFFAPTWLSLAGTGVGLDISRKNRFPINCVGGVFFSHSLLSRSTMNIIEYNFVRNEDEVSTRSRYRAHTSNLLSQILPLPFCIIQRHYYWRIAFLHALVLCPDNDTF